MTIAFNNLTQFVALLIFPLTIFILHTKFKFYFSNSFNKRNKKINNSEVNNLTLEKIIIITFQFLIIILNQKTKAIANISLALILILHIIICFSFLTKSNEKIKFWNSIANFRFIILITIIGSQLLFISWQFHNIIFARDNNFILITTFYTIFLLMTYKVFNQTLLIAKYLVFNTFKILTRKKSENFYFNQKKIFNFYSKAQAIAILWNFENLKQAKKMNLRNIEEKSQKIIKANLIIFIISLINLFTKNIIKTQKIIINGWKISLVE